MFGGYRLRATALSLFWGLVLQCGLQGALKVEGFAAGQDLSWWQSPASKKPAAINPVDINQASTEELMKIPGMTPVWAKRIVRFRPYSNKYALKLEGVLPGEVYERLKLYMVTHREK